MKDEHDSSNLGKFEERVQRNLQGTQNDVPQEQPLTFNVPDESRAEKPEERNSEIHVAEKDRKIVKRIAKIVVGTAAVGLLGWGGYTVYQDVVNRSLKMEKIVAVEQAKSSSIRADSAEAGKLAALERARQDSILAARADSIRRADSLVAIKKLEKKQEELDTQKRRTVEMAKKAELAVKIGRITGYIEAARKVNSDFKVTVDSVGIVTFPYFIVNQTGKVEFLQKQRKISVDNAYFATTDSLEANVARLSYIKQLLSREEIPTRWYEEFVNKVYNQCRQLYGRDSRIVLGQDIADKIQGFNEGDEYIFKMNNGRLEGYRTIKTSPQKPDYSTTQEKVKQGFKLEIKSEAARKESEKIGKSRKAFNDPNGGN